MERRNAGKQLGVNCPELTANPRQDIWTFPVARPSVTAILATLRRGGYLNRKAATTALTRDPAANAGGSGSTSANSSLTTSLLGD